MKVIVTKEQNDKLNHKIKSMVDKYGFKETLKLFDNNTDIIKRAYQDNPLEFLNQFNDLTPVEKGEGIFYVDENRLPLFYYYKDEKNGYVYINVGRIWSFFEDVIGLEYDEIQGIMEKWLEEVYNIKGLTPMHKMLMMRLELE